MRELVPIRYGRMLRSPFTFLRGSAALMAYDLASTPNTAIRVQTCGDCHLLNFGLFATPERNLIFDINDVCIQSALRLRNSLLMEIALVVLVFTLGHRFFFEQMTLNASIWYAIGAASELQLSPAGVWLAYISLPVYQFIFLRWLFRICVWAWFLWSVSCLDLYLLSTHPDKAGGLGFLSQSARAFIPFLLSQGGFTVGDDNRKDFVPRGRPHGVQTGNRRLYCILLILV